MSHIYTIHPSAAHLIPSQLCPSTCEAVPVVLLHETPRFRYFALGVDAVIRVSVDNVYWLARDGWAELATGLVNERSTILLAARILFKDPGARCVDAETESEPKNEGKTITDAYLAIAARFPSAGANLAHETGGWVCDIDLASARFKLWFFSNEYGLIFGAESEPLHYPTLTDALDAIARATGEAK
jgi:hypothetical protein